MAAQQHEDVSERDLPHSRCSWLHPQILIGAVPTSDTLSSIERVADVFVDLVGDSWYNKRISKEKYISFPIPQGGVVSKEKALELVTRLIDMIQNGKSIYLHCHGI